MKYEMSSTSSESDDIPEQKQTENASPLKTSAFARYIANYKDSLDRSAEETTAASSTEKPKKRIQK